MLRESKRGEEVRAGMALQGEMDKVNGILLSFRWHSLEHVSSAVRPVRGDAE